MTSPDVVEAIQKIYRKITKRPCTASVFVVRKDIPVGYYYVHPHDTAEFYSVHVKRLADRDREKVTK